MNRSVMIAGGIGIALGLYMLTGLVHCDREPEVSAVMEDASAKPAMVVKVLDMVAVDVVREVVVSGKTVPSRSVDLKTEVAGKVISVADMRGKKIHEGALIVGIALDDRQQRLEQANAALEQAQLEYDAALRLQERDLRSASQVANALSQLRGAQQMVRHMELEIGNTRIRAPFDGVLQDRLVEIGDFLSIGDPVARILDVDPIVVEGQVTEFEIQNVRMGEMGVARLAGDRVVEGVIRYVAKEADAMARTFLVELEVPNPAGDIPAGISAQIQIKTDTVRAYRISPGLISISDEGVFGVKVVDEENRVQFVEAEIVRFEPDALWLTNLPEAIRLIIVGQGFTQAGDIVEVFIESGSSSAVE